MVGLENIRAEDVRWQLVLVARLADGDDMVAMQQAQRVISGNLCRLEAVSIPGSQVEPASFRARRRAASGGGGGDGGGGETGGGGLAGSGARAGDGDGDGGWGSRAVV